MNIPTIGGAQGIFEIFVPGMFLLLNLAAIVYLFPFTDEETRHLLAASTTNGVLILVLGITFGYLIGILLRLFNTSFPDSCSAMLKRRFRHDARQKTDKFYLALTEPFPYIGWLEKVCEQFLTPDAQTFYKELWLPRKRAGENRQFFNYCKILINSCDEKAAREIYTAESLTRYISGMFYALVLSCIGILITTIMQRIFYGGAMVGLVMLLVAYLLCILAILRRFRDIRIKEVEIVFAASFMNKDIFLNWAKNASKKS